MATNSGMYNANDYIYIICRKSTYIKELKLSGPIVSPIRVKMSTAYSIVLRGVELYQYEKKYQEYAKMTIKNCFRKDKFKGYVAEQAAKTPTPAPTVAPTAQSTTGTNVDNAAASTSTKNSGKNNNKNQQQQKPTNTSTDNGGASITVNNESTEK